MKEKTDFKIPKMALGTKTEEGIKRAVRIERSDSECSVKILGRVFECIDDLELATNPFNRWLYDIVEKQEKEQFVAFLREYPNLDSVPMQTSTLDILDTAYINATYSINGICPYYSEGASVSIITSDLYYELWGLADAITLAILEREENDDGIKKFLSCVSNSEYRLYAKLFDVSDAGSKKKEKFRKLIYNKEKRNVIIKTLHELIDPQPSKIEIVLILKAAIAAGIFVSKPKYEITKAEFPDIGGVSGYNHNFAKELNSEEKEKVEKYASILEKLL